MWEWRKDQARQQAALRNNLRTSATWDEILEQSIKLTRAVVARNNQARDMAEKTLAAEASTAPVIIDRARMQKVCDEFARKQRAKENDRGLGPVEDAYKPKYRVGDDELILKNAIGQGLDERASADDLAISYRYPQRTKRRQLEQLEPLARPFAVEEKAIELEVIEQLYLARDKRRPVKQKEAPKPVILSDLKRNLRDLDLDLGL